MNARRLIVVSVLLFLFFLGIYTWNERTNKLDAISTNVGIEVVGFFVRSVVYVQTTISDFWNNYVSLVGVNEENKELKEELFQIKRELRFCKTTKRGTGPFEETSFHRICFRLENRRGQNFSMAARSK